MSVADGPNAGKSATTDASGNYTLTALQQSAFTVNVSASAYISQSKVVTLASNQTLSFQLASSVPGLTSYMRDYIQAIFLGSGPLTPPDGNYGCPTFPGTWTGFPRGTTVTIRISTTDSADKRQAIQNAAAQVSMATLGAIQTTVVSSDDPNPLPGVNEVTSTSYPTPSTQGCPTDNGCTIHRFIASGVLQSSRAVQPPSQTPNAFAHDTIGHGVMGFCHVDGNLIGGAGLSLMSAGPNVFSNQTTLQLSSADIAAAQAVYGSGLNPGATKDNFLRAGLINASSSLIPTLAGRLPTVRGAARR